MKQERVQDDKSQKGTASLSRGNVDDEAEVLRPQLSMRETVNDPFLMSNKEDPATLAHMR